MIRLLLMREVQSGNVLAYRHWRYRQEDRDAWTMLIRSALARMPAMPPVTTKRTCVITAYRSRMLDTDNLSAGCKHLRDALVRAGLLVDDNALWSTWTYQQLPARHSTHGLCTTCEIEEAS